jgi:hypothetical protein
MANVQDALAKAVAEKLEESKFGTLWGSPDQAYNLLERGGWLERPKDTLSKVFVDSTRPAVRYTGEGEKIDGLGDPRQDGYPFGLDYLTSTQSVGETILLPARIAAYGKIGWDEGKKSSAKQWSDMWDAKSEQRKQQAKEDFLFNMQLDRSEYEIDLMKAQMDLIPFQRENLEADNKYKKKQASVAGSQASLNRANAKLGRYEAKARAFAYWKNVIDVADAALVATLITPADNTRIKDNAVQKYINALLAP